jgi:hypothetical protein
VRGGLWVMVQDGLWKVAALARGQETTNERVGGRLFSYSFIFSTSFSHSFLFLLLPFFFPFFFFFHSFLILFISPLSTLSSLSFFSVASDDDPRGGRGITARGGLQAAVRDGLWKVAALARGRETTNGQVGGSQKLPPHGAKELLFPAACHIVFPCHR